MTLTQELAQALPGRNDLLNLAARTAELVPVSLLRELFCYDADTGAIWYRTHGRDKKCGSIGAGGYVLLKHKDARLRAHRVAWALHYGSWPDGFVDHLNRNRADNRICNLRLSTWAQNQQNKGRISSNTSGYKGVSFHRLTGKWQARIRCNGERFDLGLFLTAKEAGAAYAAASKTLHGEFAYEK